LKQFNGGKRGKEINGFLKIQSTKELITALEASDSTDTNIIVSKIIGAGKNQGTWTHPFLFL
jgi:hypothetical protein